MKKIGIFYGSTTGTTQEVAQQIADCLGVDETDVHDVASTSPSAVGDYDVLIIGASTWGPEIYRMIWLLSSMGFSRWT